MKGIAKIGIGISLALAIWSCKDDDSFPETPELFFRDFIEGTDSLAVWSLGFTDGDGDIGVRNDNDPDNFIISGYKIVNGQEDTLPPLLSYRIPVVRNVVTKNGIEGEFEFKIEKKPYANAGFDSIYISGYVIDRAGNQSNTVRTPIFRTN